MVVEGGVEEDLHQILVQICFLKAFHSTYLSTGVSHCCFDQGTMNCDLAAWK